MSGARPISSHEAVWRQYDAVESRLTASVSERLLDLAGLAPGMRVLDLATGRGEPALRAAHRVGPRGQVLGIDLSAPLVEMAREQAVREGLSNLELRAADAERLDDLPSGHFHAATVRWGLMYMTHPVAALAHVRRALLPSGVLVAALWAEPERVPYYTLPRRLAEPYCALPVFDPEAPGVFRYADIDRLQRDFRLAGFALDHVEEVETAVFEAATPAEMIAWVRALGLTRLLNGVPEASQDAWEAGLARALESTRDAAGAPLRLGGVTRLVRAVPG